MTFFSTTCSSHVIRRKTLPLALVMAGLVTALAAAWVFLAVEPAAAQTGECSNGIAVPNPKRDRGLVIDCETLLAARDEIAGTGALDWTPRRPISEWEGIRIDRASRRVIDLVIPERRLNGTLSPALAKLTALEVLSLDTNQLQGGIPAEYGVFPKLRQIHLNGNRLTGPIPPELGDLFNLQWLGLAGNRLSGTIPPELANTRLYLVELQGNGFSGTLPLSLTRLKGVKSFHFERNAGLCAPSDPSFQSWLKSIERAEGDNCSSLPPPLPTSGECSNGIAVPNPVDNPKLVADCEALLAARDVIAGSGALDWAPSRPISEWEGIGIDVVSLRVTSLVIPERQLSGKLSPALANLNELHILSLHNNRLQGGIPAEYGALPKLREIYLFDNQLTGPIPPELGDLTNLRVLALAKNQLSGAIPPELGNTRLVWVELQSNELEGTLPQSLTKLQGVLYLHFERNSGLCAPTEAPFQSWLKGIETAGGDDCSPSASTSPPPSPTPTLLTSANCSNGIAVPDPATNPGLMADCEALLAARDTLNPEGTLDWSLNQPIRTWHGVTLDGPSSRVVELKVVTGNRATGQIPPELGQLSALAVLYLEGQLTGQIPPELGNLTNLKDLNLGNNRLTGTVPPELGNLPNLNWLALSNNQLTGTIPVELENLEYLDRLLLDENDFSGCMPSGLRRLSELEFDQTELIFCDGEPPALPLSVQVAGNTAAVEASDLPQGSPLPAQVPGNADAVQAPDQPPPTPTPLPGVQRGFFTNSVPSASAITTPGAINLLDPVILSVLGILITLMATSIQLFRGR